MFSRRIHILGISLGFKPLAGFNDESYVYKHQEMTISTHALRPTPVFFAGNPEMLTIVTDTLALRRPRCVSVYMRCVHMHVCMHVWYRLDRLTS